MLLDLDAVIHIVASAPREQRKGMESTPQWRDCTFGKEQ
jgi:hypothetical protein